MNSNETGPEIEKSWKRVEKLLAKKDEASAALAVVEAYKIFEVVLDVVSYGPTTDDKIKHASNLFRDEGKVLEAVSIYHKVINQVGFVITSRQAKFASEWMMNGILDLVGRDYEPRSFGVRMANNLNYFWGHHPKFLSAIVLGVLAFVAVVWTLAETAWGQWLTGIGVGFAKFVVANPGLMVALIVVLAVAWWGSKFFWFSGRED